MRIFIATITGILTIVNYMWHANAPGSLPQAISVALQMILAIIAVVMLIGYKGQRTRLSYERNGVRIFTMGFAIIVLATLGSVAALIVFFLQAFGIISSM